jgi:hypothetical protein
MRLKSEGSVAKTGTASLKTTIPKGIVAYLYLKAGDTIEWGVEVIGRRERVVVLVKKVIG